MKQQSAPQLRTRKPAATAPEAAKSQFAIGLAMAIVTTVIAALQPVVMRYGALRSDPLLFSTIAVVAAGMSAATVLGCRGELGLIVQRRYAPRLCALSVTGTLMTSLLLIYGLRRIDAIAGVILLESEPIFSLVLATIFLGERPSLRQLLATGMILAGIGSVLGASHAFSPLYAAVLIFLTPLFWQISHVISLGVMPPFKPLALTGARYIYAAVMLALTVVLIDFRSLAQLADPVTLVTGIFTGAFVYFLGSLSWYGAISRLALTWTTAFVIPGVPILSFGFAMIFLGERPGPRELIGLVVAIIGVVALVTGAGAARHSSLEAAEAAHQPIG